MNASAYIPQTEEMLGPKCSASTLFVRLGRECKKASPRPRIDDAISGRIITGMHRSVTMLRRLHDNRRRTSMACSSDIGQLPSQTA
mmetsp:Transcript_98874/g.155853  ORF Transcript_98874/g.155853 Transcript_98874/m.155853 type:complete len:86 (-) Transcript_98874:6-263(-)